MQDDRDFRDAAGVTTKDVSGKRRAASRMKAASSGEPKRSIAAGPRIKVRQSRPVQLNIFDYAAANGVTLLPEAS